MVFEGFQWFFQWPQWFSGVSVFSPQLFVTGFQWFLRGFIFFRWFQWLFRSFEGFHGFYRSDGAKPKVPLLG